MLKTNKMISKNKFLLIFFLISFSNFAQDHLSAIQVLQKSSEKYNKETYLSYNTSYKLYLDYTTKKVHEQYNGIILKKNNVNYVKIKETEFVTFKDCALKINNDQKALIYQKTNQSKDESPFLLASYLKGFDITFVEQSKDYYVCVVKPPKVSQVMLSKAVVYIRKADLSMVKQIVYFVQKMESKDSEGKTISTIPRLEIEYLEKQANAVEEDFLVTKSNYIIQTKNELQFSKRLASYKLYNM